MAVMEPKITPTVVTTLTAFGSILRALRAMAGWSQREAGLRYGCVAGLVSLREYGKRQAGITDAAHMLKQHDYVLVVMHRDDAAALPRVRWGEPDA
jgi:hypothetical protein